MIRAAFLALIWLALPGAAGAAEWAALVIGTGERGSDAAADDVATARMALSQSDPRALVTLEAPTRAELSGALGDIPVAEGVILYLAGPTRTVEDMLVLRLADGEVPLGAVLDRMAERGAPEAVLLHENCPAPGMRAPWAEPKVPEGMTLTAIASVAPGAVCADGDARLTSALARAGAAGGSDWADGLWTAATGAPSLSLFGVSPFPVVAGAGEVSVVTDDAVTVMPVGPSDAAVALPDASVIAENAVARVGDGAALPGALLAALPQGAGLPEPSIIVGRIETPEAFETLDLAVPEVIASDVRFDDLDGRRALRDSDPVLFDSLVDSGAFDPPEDGLVVALQTELARMGCYTAGIDGQWGAGSRTSVTRYFEQLDGVEAPGLAPTPELFRAVLRNDDVTCPELVAAPAPARPSVTPAPARQTTPAPARAAPAPQRQAAPVRRTTPAPTPQPTPQPQRRINPNALGTGVFR
ncbi:hypothetical protein [Roseivivax marinus]|uniref:hypothetical protein n=1 Tax=Roseivivax marinus TaxID=1379903 RepID=UPI00273F6526|nr:hypothetical protein [Roseivivax marinus]